MLELIDSHCHLDTEPFDEDREAMFQRAFDAGVRAMVVPGIAIADMPRVLEMADRYPHVYVAVGVHPHECETWTDETRAQLKT
jgi:TatD DNase family protein